MKDIRNFFSSNNNKVRHYDTRDDRENGDREMGIERMLEK
jgi:hypothetical protein